MKAGKPVKNATIKAVARDAGVSVATVSRVINQLPNVSPELIIRVNRSIEKLNYFPNTIARSLKFDSTLSIGLIISDISNSFFCYIARTIEDVIHTENYNMFVCSTDNRQNIELSYLKLLMGKKVDGIIINTTGMNDDLITSISQEIPVVLCGRKINNTAFKGDFVDSENETGSYELTKHLLKLGHRRIAVVNGQSVVSPAQERHAGFARAMEEYGILIDASYPYILEADFNDSGTGALAAEKLMALKQPPTAVIAMNNELATGVLRYCYEHKIRVPEDLSLCTYGKILNNDLLFVQPCRVEMDPVIIGNQLARFMLERIAKKNEIANREYRVNAPLVNGSACAPPRD